MYNVQSFNRVKTGIVALNKSDEKMITNANMQE
jgi:hypothetical protein